MLGARDGEDVIGFDVGTLVGIGVTMGKSVGTRVGICDGWSVGIIVGISKWTKKNNDKMKKFWLKLSNHIYVKDKEKNIFSLDFLRILKG